MLRCVRQAGEKAQQAQQWEHGEENAGGGGQRHGDAKRGRGQRSPPNKSATKGGETGKKAIAESGSEPDGEMGGRGSPRMSLRDLRRETRCRRQRRSRRASRQQPCPRTRRRPPNIGGKASEGAAVEPRSEPNGGGERAVHNHHHRYDHYRRRRPHVEREGSSLALGRGVGHERRRDGQEGDRRVGQRAGRRDGRVAQDVSNSPGLAGSPFARPASRTLSSTFARAASPRRARMLAAADPIC